MKKKYTYRQLILAERDPFIQRQKISAFNALLQIMALLCFSLVISPITSGAWKLAVVYLGLGTWFLINDLFLNKIKNHILVLFTTLTGAYLILAYQFWIERNMEFGMDAYWLWIIIVPFIANFSGGIFYGNIAALGGWILAVIFMWSPVRDLVQDYGTNMTTFYPIDYLCVMIVASCIQYKMTSYQLFRKEAESELAFRQKERFQRMEEQITIYEENETNIRKLKHDIRHFNRVLRAYLKDGEVGKALEYLDQIAGKLEDVKNTNYCDNKLINGLLTVYVSHAKKSKCDIKVKAIVPELIAIDAIDLTSIIANAIENAAEAIRRVEEEKRYIRVSIIYDAGKLKIEVKNSCFYNTKFNDDGLPQSSKVVKSGIGTKNIKELAEKYGGFASFKQKDDIFVMKAIINC
ncbi:GHKL domain-containing protein [Lachnobacterium bovis]|uniref:GHKL domain-containing protein n=1 Tax=Lachnobacterium bovis DSM 14045 TaxID=1122142 RepID=A0A1H3FBL6_9FIRM|nr:GHKL domain-containing protein [Lachnobacterium bovis]SDX87594.1 GHKL domain-containing protein [Lachnobacterium bovis DSM 14045]